MAEPEVQAVINHAILEVERLLALLRDAHPGLNTWLDAVDHQAQRVAWTFGYAYRPNQRSNR